MKIVSLPSCAVNILFIVMFFRVNIVKAIYTQQLFLTNLWRSFTWSFVKIMYVVNIAYPSLRCVACSIWRRACYVHLEEFYPRIRERDEEGRGRISVNEIDHIRGSSAIIITGKTKRSNQMRISTCWRNELAWKLPTRKKLLPCIYMTGSSAQSGNLNLN